MEPERRDPALDAAVFPDTPLHWFWTSTVTTSQFTTHARLVHFGEGQPNYALRMNQNALCAGAGVRVTGQQFSF